jgi:hypothetical protein
MIVIVLFGVTLGDFRGKDRFDTRGAVAVPAALVCGAAGSGPEDEVMGEYGAPQDKTNATIYSVGAIMGAANAELRLGVVRASQHSMCLADLPAFSGLGALGIEFAYLLTKVFGSLVTVMVASARKGLTNCLSSLIFRDKVLTTGHARAMASIATAVGLGVYHQRAKPHVREDGDERDLLAWQEVDTEKA